MRVRRNWATSLSCGLAVVAVTAGAATPAAAAPGGVSDELDLTRENSLPQKLLVLHQFRVEMIPDRERVDLSRDELSVMVNADGQGPQRSKQETWRVPHGIGTEGTAWGWKNFYDEDVPMLTPEETVAVEPRPNLISYQ